MIVVGVAIETAKQIKTQVQEQEYRGLWTTLQWRKRYAFDFNRSSRGRKRSCAEYLKTHYDIPHISTGEMFREAISKQTEIGILLRYI